MEKISDILRRELNKALERETVRAIAERVGIDHTQLHRFAKGERTLRQGTIDELGDKLGLQLVARKRRGTKKG